MNEPLAHDPLAWLQARPPASPARQRVLQVLADRAAAAPPGPLREQLLRALQRQAERPDAVLPQDLPPPAAEPGPLQALAALVQRLRAASAGTEPRVLQQHARAFGELRTARRLAEVAAPVPEHLGPLNNQVLVRRALQQLQQLSPDYLQRFIEQVDSLAALAPLLAVDTPDTPRPAAKAPARSPRTTAAKTPARPAAARKTGTRR
ncbi:MAG: hypothetical protein DI603_08835 [Roseateles depolymerans]|uniref:DUF2894 domain-containing protein n=1 Tax=Roseateles depolymerans TaxID=76731 RepID=A0A2W5FV56_9BURK|nr:MAG: hypothetical protein DI603_08835 [Roseateles depolymerans]